MAIPNSPAPAAPRSNDPVGGSRVRRDPAVGGGRSHRSEGASSAFADLLRNLQPRENSARATAPAERRGHHDPGSRAGSSRAGDCEKVDSLTDVQRTPRDTPLSDDRVSDRREPDVETKDIQDPDEPVSDDRTTPAGPSTLATGGEDASFRLRLQAANPDAPGVPVDDSLAAVAGSSQPVSAVSQSAVAVTETAIDQQEPAMAVGLGTTAVPTDPVITGFVTTSPVPTGPATTGPATTGPATTSPATTNTVQAADTGEVIADTDTTATSVLGAVPEGVPSADSGSDAPPLIASVVPNAQPTTAETAPTSDDAVIGVAVEGGTTAESPINDAAPQGAAASVEVPTADSSITDSSMTDRPMSGTEVSGLAGSTPPPAEPGTAATVGVAARPAVTTPPAAQLASAVAALRRRGDGEYTATLDLHPSELGRVQVQVEIRAGVVNLQVLAEQSATRVMLAQQLDDLRSALQQGGFQAGDLDVSSQTWTGGQPDNAQPDDDATTDDRSTHQHSVDAVSDVSRPLAVATANGLDLRL